MRKNFTKSTGTKSTGMRKLLSLARSLLQAGPGQTNPGQTKPAAAPGPSRPAGVPGQEANGAIIQALSNLPRQRPRDNNPDGPDTAARDADVYVTDKVVWLMDPDYYDFQTCVCDVVSAHAAAGLHTCIYGVKTLTQRQCCMTCVISLVPTCHMPVALGCR